MDQLEAGNHPRVMSEAQTRIHRLAMARLCALEKEIEEKHHCKLMCGIELEFNYRTAQGYYPAVPIMLSKYNELASQIFAKDETTSFIKSPFVHVLEPDGNPEQQCYEFKISAHNYINAHYKDRAHYISRFAPSVIARATTAIRDLVQKKTPLLFPGHQAQFMAADPVEDMETADIHVNLSIWNENYDKSLQYKMNFDHAVEIQKLLFPLVIESKNSLARFGAHASIATEFRHEKANKCGNSVGERVLESPDSYRMEDRLSGADADPALSTLLAVSGVYWTLEHGKTPMPLDDTIAAIKRIPKTREEYGVFLKAFEKSDVARELLGEALFQEIVALRREQYAQMPIEQPAALITEKQALGKIAGHEISK